MLGLIVPTVNFTILCFNRLPRTRLITVRILSTGGIISNHKVLDIHCKWSLSVVCQTTGPFDSSWLIAWITTSPSTHHNIHWRLWVTLTGGIFQSSNRLTIQVPNGFVHSPVNGIVVKINLWLVNTMESTSVISFDITL